MKYTFENINKRAKDILGELSPILIFDYSWTKQYNCKSHWHDWVEIVYVQSGTLKVRVNEQSYILYAGDFIYINPSDIHETNHDGAGKALVIQVMNSYLKKVIINLDKIKIECCSVNEIELNSKKYKEIEKLILDMYKAFQDKNDFDRVGTLGYCNVIMYKLMKWFQIENTTCSNISEKYKERLNIIINYINRNCFEDISLKSVAYDQGVSPQYLSKIFKKYLSTTFKEYLNEVRLEAAYRDLVNTDLSMIEITMNCGFANTQSFNKIFKERYGVLPSVYRKNFKGNKKFKKIDTIKLE